MKGNKKINIKLTYFELTDVMTAVLQNMKSWRDDARTAATREGQLNKNAVADKYAALYDILKKQFDSKKVVE